MSESIRSRPSTAASSLLLTAGREKAMSLANLGMEAFERGMEAMLTNSADLLRTYLNERSERVKEFADRLGIQAPALRQCLDGKGFAEEPPVPPNPELGQDRAPITLPIKEGMRAARDRANAAGREEWTAGEFVAEAVAHSESAVSKVLRELGVTEEAIASALDWLRHQPEESVSPDDMVARMMKDSRAMMYRLTTSSNESLPKIPELEKYRAEEAAKPLGSKPDLVAKLKEPVPEALRDRVWSMRLIAVREAVRWEARSRYAPEATLEHLLLALIQDGTDTSWFLDRHGVDREGLRWELEAACPTFPEGPGLPPDSAPLMLSQPDEPKPPRPFTDLGYVSSMLWHEEQPAVRMLKARGVTENHVKFAIREWVTGDSEWHLRRPDLATGLRYTGKFSHETNAARTEAVEEAARYEARRRGSPKLTGDHFVYALLSHETETRAWVTSLGIDPDALAARLDEVMARSDAPIAFPDRTMGLPIGWHDVGVPFTDLAMLRDLLDEKRFVLPEDAEFSPALLAEVGIDADRVREALPPQRPLLEVMEEEVEAYKRSRE